MAEPGTSLPTQLTSSRAPPSPLRASRGTQFSPSTSLCRGSCTASCTLATVFPCPHGRQPPGFGLSPLWGLSFSALSFSGGHGQTVSPRPNHLRSPPAWDCRVGFTHLNCLLCPATMDSLCLGAEALNIHPKPSSS